MYEICLHCHLLGFSWFRMNYDQGAMRHIWVKRHCVHLHTGRFDIIFPIDWIKAIKIVIFQDKQLAEVDLNCMVYMHSKSLENSQMRFIFRRKCIKIRETFTNLKNTTFFIFYILQKYIWSFHKKNKTWFFNLQLNNFTNNFVLLLCPWRVLKNLNLKLGFELSTKYLFGQ